MSSAYLPKNIQYTDRQHFYFFDLVIVLTTSNQIRNTSARSINSSYDIDLQKRRENRVVSLDQNDFYDILCRILKRVSNLEWRLVNLFWPLSSATTARSPRRYWFMILKSRDVGHVFMAWSTHELQSFIYLLYDNDMMSTY